jgi:dephospho-CoA kinase
VDTLANLNMSQTITIGLTGGIAMGKSIVAKHLVDRYGWIVLDADLIARDAVLPGSPILQSIARRYGSALIQPDGSLDRQQLGTIVFADSQERHWLEQQIHPFVREQLQRGRDQAIRFQEKAVVLMVPLLFEAGMADLVDQVWVVACTEAQQIQHLIQRDGLTEAQAKARIASQMPIAEKRQRADRVFENDGTLATLLTQVDEAVTQIG